MTIPSPVDLTFDAVNEFVHHPDRAPEELQCLALTLATRIAELERERDHWKANYDNQVQRARILLERPDLPIERVRAYHRMEALEMALAAAQNKQLTPKKG
ncbi:hypothetical protein CEK28_08625 [Xenophilus sp. AP218F]|nr:hypothetical protein CEK28_08625 [Xenophilus sp. AP218F]